MFRELIKSWLAADRIRVAPEVGRLLRLKVGDTIVLLDDSYVVQQREVGGSDDDDIRYVLESDGERAVLQVIRGQIRGRTEAELMIGTSTRPVFDQDVVVLKSFG